MDSATIKITPAQEGILILSLNRPEKRNALSIELMDELRRAIEQAGNDKRTRAVILSGEGPMFCAGLDLKEAQDIEKADQSAHYVAKMLEAVYFCPCPTIAAVHGAAYAGGAGLMGACDFAIADEQAEFGFPETRRGLIPALIIAVLMRQMGLRELKELFLFGETIKGERAVALRLVNRIVKREELIPQALNVARQCLLGAPKATSLTKKMLDSFSPHSFSAQIERAMKIHAEMRKSPEAEEGIAAFIEKRTPNWPETR